MMDIPDVVRVACFDVRVERWGGRQAHAETSFGEFSQEECVIRIDATLPGPMLLNFFLHELFHAIYWAYGICDEDKEERLCGVLSTALTQVLRDNPELVKWLGEMTGGG